VIDQVTASERIELEN
jgi:hypothetical protein